MMREHDLKTWPQFFDVFERGIKTFEIREQEDGRHFAVGDTLRLREWNPQHAEYTGREVRRVVTYITTWEQKRGFVVMAIAPLLPAAGEAPSSNSGSLVSERKA